MKLEKIDIRKTNFKETFPYSKIVALLIQDLQSSKTINHGQHYHQLRLYQF